MILKPTFVLNLFAAESHFSVGHDINTRTQSCGTKPENARPLRREKRNDIYSSPRWSAHIQNSQPCRCFKDHLSKVSSVNHNNRRKLKLKNRERRVLKRIASQKRKTTLPQITSEMNTSLQNPVSMKTIQR
ncbi:hypothetical protein TNCV_739421 [Trichonephila clavipes]|nr:hypothetical protein TNCV_739421 [Trichonephila clavipes]